MTADDGGEQPTTTSTLSRGEALRARGGRQASDAVDSRVKTAFEMAQALKEPGTGDAQADGETTGLLRASKGQRRETQTLLRLAGEDIDASMSSQGLAPTPASALRRQTQTVLRLANEELDRKEAVATAAGEAAVLAVGAAAAAAAAAAKAARLAANAAEKEVQRRKDEKAQRTIAALAADVLPLMLIIDPDASMDATRFAAQEAMPALIKAAEEKIKELNKAAAVAAARARAAEEKALAAQRALEAAAEAQRRAEEEAKAALEAEVADALRRLKEDAAAAEIKAQAALPEAMLAQTQLEAIKQTFADKLAALAAAASSRM